MGIIHVHSSYSHDGNDSIARLRADALRRGIGFVALTDHAEDLNSARWDEYVAECRGHSDDAVAIIPGLEFRFRGHTGVHLLALGLRAWDFPRTPDEFVAGTAPSAALTIVAHPVLCGYRVPNAVREGIDAVEIWNANYNTRYLPDPRAIRLLRELRRARPEVVGTAGLDQHDSRNDRGIRIRIATTAADPLPEIRAGRFTNCGRTMQLDPTVSWGAARDAALTAARWIFDRVEPVQDRTVRFVRSIGGR